MRTIKFLLVFSLCLILKPNSFAQSQAGCDQFFLDDLNFSVYIPCEQEYATGTYSLHYFRTSTNDGKRHLIMLNTSNSKLIGQNTGIVYKFIDNAHYLNYPRPSEENGSDVWIDTERIMYVGQYGVQYMYLKLNILFTWDPDGEPRLELYSNESWCE